MPEDNSDAMPHVGPDWPTCAADVCIGRQIEGFERCLAHLGTDERDDVLRRFAPSDDVDLRGTTLTIGLLERLLTHMSEDPADPAALVRLGRADFRYCHFHDDDDASGTERPEDAAVDDGTGSVCARFKGVWFSGDAVFSGARFSGNAVFGHAQFSGDAWFDGVRFDGDARFDRARFDGVAGFHHARFDGDARFGDVQFDRYAVFDGAQFSGYAGFGGARFGLDAKFSGARFAGNAVFHSAQFNGYALFRRTRFGDLAGFGLARFSGYARFDGAEFGGDAEFVGARFMLGTAFDGAQFSGAAEFIDAHFSGDAKFADARFEVATKFGPLATRALDVDRASFAKLVIVEVEADRLSADDARFERGVELRVRRPEVSMRRTHFGGPSSVSGMPAPFKSPKGRSVAAVPEQLTAETAGSGSTVAVVASDDRRPVGLEAWVPRLLSVQETDVAQLTLADVDLRWCRFAGTHHLDELSLEGRSPFNRPPNWQAGWAWPPVWRWTTRRVLAEEHPWRAGRRKSGGWSKELPDLDGAAQVPPVGPERLAVLYRSLRKAFEDAKNEAGAGDFYYGEMEARRHAPSTSRAERALLTAYWLISGYGQRATRALAALVMLIGVLFVLLTQHGLPDSTALQQMTGTVPAAAAGQPQQITFETTPAPAILPPQDQLWTTDRMRKAIRIALGSVIFRDTDQKLTPAGVWTVMAGRAFGPLLLALAALAIRARVKR
ncbi:pentapeptide repeat-containing protein [Amycolatopsis sp. NPDC049688]|uniref:pentapeptide repeat-containing protein n=1 Tax=Amycolatopsis sp. NPDC049688 TaxID=3154733 RepID=UPI00342EEEA8